MHIVTQDKERDRKKKKKEIGKIDWDFDDKATLFNALILLNENQFHQKPKQSQHI